MTDHVLGSKTNQTAFASIIIGILISNDIVPAQFENLLTEFALVGLPVLVVMFRSVFTKYPLRWKFW